MIHSMTKFCFASARTWLTTKNVECKAFLIRQDQCFSFNGTQLNVPESSYPQLPVKSGYHHQMIRMGRYLGHPFAAGGMDNNVHVEKYDFDLRKWKNLGD